MVREFDFSGNSLSGTEIINWLSARCAGVEMDTGKNLIDILSERNEISLSAAITHAKAHLMEHNSLLHN